MTTLSQPRLDYLDAVRAFALLLGIVFHASLSFMPIFIGWAVMDISTSQAVAVFGMISHSFRMELFFLIAGFFSHMTYHRLGWQGFLKSRVVRIGLPFVFGWFVLRPLLVAGWIAGMQSMRGDEQWLLAFKEGFASLGDLPSNLFVGTHLWFLYYLFFITLAVVLLRNAIGLLPSVADTFKRASDSLIAWLCSSPMGLFVIALPTILCLWFMQRWGVDTPDQSLWPHLPVTALYAGCFVFGWCLQRQGTLIQRWGKLSWGRGILACVAALICVLLSPYESQPGHMYFAEIKLAFTVAYAVMMWSMVVVSLGVCSRLFSRASKWVRYVADASYWLYLIHLPIVVGLQVVFAELPLHWLVKLFSICIITMVISIALYEAFVRTSFIGATLNGKRKPHVWTLESKSDAHLTR